MEVDTVYFDKEWTILETPHFAHYYRVLEVNGDATSAKHFRDYYITGEIYEDGQYVTFDKKDTYKFIKQGEWTRYYKSGAVMETGFIDNGKSEGLYTYYYENGSIRRRCTYLHNLRHGVSTDFTQDGLCIQREYQFDVPVTNYYTISDEDGFFSKVRADNHTPVWESPELDSLKTTVIDKETWDYYASDGISILLKMAKVSDFGNYYRLYIHIANNSFFPIFFSPDSVSATLTTRDDEEIPLVVQTAEMYDKRIRRTQLWEEIIYGFAAGLSQTENSSTFLYASNTKKTVEQATYYAPTSVANVFGNTYIQAKRPGMSYYGTRHTTTYNSQTVYMMQSNAAASLCAYSLLHSLDRQSHNEDYLKDVVIDPGKSIYGYINVKHKKGDILNVNLSIENADYRFPIYLVAQESLLDYKQKKMEYERLKEERAKEKNFNKVYDKYETMLKNLAMRDNGEFSGQELEIYKSNFQTYSDWFEKESPNLTDKMRKKWKKLTKLYSNRLKRLNFI